jgi:protein-disulfide isomerase
MIAGRMSRPVLVVLALAAAAAAACSRARSADREGDPQGVVARVAGRPITQKELDAKAVGALQRLKQQEYDARREALDELVTERLLDAEADSQHLSREELLKREVDGKVARPTPEEVDRVYAENKDRVGGRTRADVGPEIERSLVQRRSVERAQAYMEELKKKGRVEVLLVEPRSEVPIPASAQVLGPGRAPVTIVEFSDYLCPYCQRAEGAVAGVLARYQGKVRFVHRDFLLGRPRSMAVARAAQCAGDQGKFWDYRHGLLTQAGDWTDQDLVRRAAPLGLDGAAFQACLASDRHDKTILDSSEEGQRLGVNATPTFFINGRRIAGVRSVEQFAEVVDAELKSGG